MPPIVTSLPWLSRDIDPVATYQRSQQLVQQMEAQRAQQQQQQAELSLRAQENAMQAGFQQRALALKEQEARSSVQLEADRLRQRGQARAFEEQQFGQAQAFKEQQAAFENQLRSRPPEVVKLAGMPPGIMAGGRFYPGTRTPDVSGIGKAIEVKDASGRVIGHVGMTSERGGALIPDKTGPTIEEKGLALAEKDFVARQRSAESLDKRLLEKEQDRLAGQARPGTQFWEEATPEERTASTGRLAEIQRRLDVYRTAPAKPEAQKPPTQVLNEARAALANQLEKDHPDWSSGHIYDEVKRQIP